MPSGQPATLTTRRQPGNAGNASNGGARTIRPGSPRQHRDNQRLERGPNYEHRSLEYALNDEVPAYCLLPRQPGARGELDLRCGIVAAAAAAHPVARIVLK